MKKLQKQVSLHLMPDGTYQRYSEGDFIRLKDGGILFVLSRFQGMHDDAPSELVGYVSRDEGGSWENAGTVLKAESLGMKNVMSVSLMRMLDGAVGLFFIAKTAGGMTFRVYLMRSYDEGKTFVSPVLCSLYENESIYVLNNCRVERLKSGRIVIPLAYHRLGRRQDGSRMYDMRAVSCFMLSDDDGKTFYEAPDTLCLNDPLSRHGLQEPGVVELDNGVLWAYMRTDRHVQYQSYSFDGGLHWTPSQPSRFTSPLSPMTIKKDGNGALYAVFNPIPDYLGRSENPWQIQRTPYVISVSRDQGATFSVPVVIEDDPDCGYCYTGFFFTDDGHILLSYCSGSDKRGTILAETTVSRIAVSELMDTQEPEY